MHLRFTESESPGERSRTLYLTIKPTGVALHLDCERIGSVRAILKTSDILLMSLCKVVGQKSSGKFRTIMDVKRDEKD